MSYGRNRSRKSRAQANVHERLVSQSFVAERAEQIRATHEKLPHGLKKWVGKRTLEALTRQEKRREARQRMAETYPLLDTVMDAAEKSGVFRMVARGSEGEQLFLRATNIESGQASLSLRGPRADRDTLQINRRKRVDSQPQDHPLIYDVIRFPGERSRSSGVLDQLKVDDQISVLSTLQDVLSPVVHQLEAAEMEQQDGVTNINRYRIETLNPQPKVYDAAKSDLYGTHADAQARDGDEFVPVTSLFRRQASQDGHPDGSHPEQIA